MKNALSEAGLRYYFFTKKELASYPDTSNTACFLTPSYISLTFCKGIWDKNLLKHKENIFLLKQGDKEDLKNAILLFLKDNQLRQKIEVNARKLVERYFNVEIMKDNLIKILEVSNWK